jgi:hypothetical protein
VKRLLYETCAVALGFPLIMWLIVAPMLTAASTVLNFVGLIIVIVSFVEFLFLGRRIINKLNERIEN